MSYLRDGRRRGKALSPQRLDRFLNVLYHLAWQSIFRESWAEAYYQRKRQEGKSHSMAARALANVWVRIIHAMGLKHEPYDAQICLAAWQTHGSQAA